MARFSLIARFYAIYDSPGFSGDIFGLERCSLCLTSGKTVATQSSVVLVYCWTAGGR